MALIAKSQVITATGGSVSSLNALFSSAVTAGNTIVVHYSAGGFNPLSTAGSSVLLFDPIDNVNAGAYSTAISTQGVFTANLGKAGICYKLAISSGAAASTYRVRFDTFSAVGFASMACYEYTNIASFDKAVSTAAVSSSPTTVSQTATAVGNLFSAVGAPFSGSTLTARSTGLPTGMTVTIVDQNNANQLMLSGESINTSSLTVQPTFRIAASTSWMALSAIFIASTGGGATGCGYWPSLCMVGCQDKTL